MGLAIDGAEIDGGLLFLYALADAEELVRGDPAGLPAKEGGEFLHLVRSESMAQIEERTIPASWVWSAPLLSSTRRVAPSGETSNFMPLSISPPVKSFWRDHCLMTEPSRPMW